MRNLIASKEHHRGQLKVDCMNVDKSIEEKVRAIKAEAERINSMRKEVQKVKR